MKKTVSLFLVLLICLSCCFCVSADGVQPRWKVLSYLDTSLSRYNGLYNNAEILANADTWDYTVRIDMNVTITRWNGKVYADTDTSWNASEEGAVCISHKFHLGEGNYKARTTVQLYDQYGNYIETVVGYSDEIII